MLGESPEASVLLAEFDLPTVGVNGGGGAVNPKFAQVFAGVHLLLVPDRDTPAERGAQKNTALLQGIAAEVVRVALPVAIVKSGGADVRDVLKMKDGRALITKAIAAARPIPLDAEPAAEPTPGDGFPLTDTGLAERFAQQHAENARYCYPWSGWLAWDGCRWNPDCTGIVEQHAKQTARSILHEAASEPNGDRCKELTTFALRAESAVRRSAMLRLAQSEPGIPILPDELDTDPWLLTVTNGTLELRTGTLREHRRADLITKLAPVEYHADAGWPTWLRFLTDIFRGNSDLVAFVQRLLGYCLTGSVAEQILPILYGTGSNGKSTAVNVVLEMLGTDYSMKAPADLLMLKRDSHPTERADLHGKRLVACVETEEHRRLAESLTKDLTGGDRVRARKMRQDFWEFTPTHKIVLACNHKPVIKGTDHAIWRRIRLVPFTVTIDEAEQDKELPEKLRAELPGILAWTVRGCLDWQQHGLGTPNEVAQATDEYRTEQDTIGEFVAACCETGSYYRTKAGDLFDAYVEWSGDKRMGKRRFGLALRERGFTDTRGTGGARYWQGIGLAEGGEK